MLPCATPQIPVKSVDQAIEFYLSRMEFRFDWGYDGWYANLSNGHLKLCLKKISHHEVRKSVISICLKAKNHLEILHDKWTRNGVIIRSVFSSTQYGLHEFTALDCDKNEIHVYLDMFSLEGDLYR